jgi:hypothetical protein
LNHLQVAVVRALNDAVGPHDFFLLPCVDCAANGSAIFSSDTT